MVALDDSIETCKHLRYSTASVAETRPGEECSAPDPAVRKALANRAKALAILSDVRYEINYFRDNVWEGIVNARNRLADTSVLLGFAAYALLGLAIFSDSPHRTITWVITYFLIGALTGLRARRPNGARRPRSTTSAWPPRACFRCRGSRGWPPWAAC